MAKRCIYYVSDGILYRQDMIIDWELGFTKEAKRVYIKRMQDSFPIKSMLPIDVTSASPDWETRSLSPIYLKVKDKDQSVEDYLADCKTMLPRNVDRSPFNAYVYLTSLGEKEALTIVRHQAYFDVFHNPERAVNNTQAYWCAMFKYLFETGNIAILNEYAMFLQWFEIFSPTLLDTIVEQEREQNPMAESFEDAEYEYADDGELPFG